VADTSPETAPEAVPGTPSTAADTDVAGEAEAGAALLDDDAEGFVMLVDPAWTPEGPDAEPDLENVVGVWPLEPDGGVGRFRANPEYRPLDENSPTDPVDAVLKLLMRQQASAEALQLILRDCLVDVAMNGDGRPIVGRSPDDLPCVLVATSGPYRETVAPPEWERVGVEHLASMLDDGVDVLFNPGSTATVRINGDFIRETALMSEDEVAAALVSLGVDPADETLHEQLAASTGIPAAGGSAARSSD
jgi:hypothetical protein